MDRVRFIRAAETIPSLERPSLLNALIACLDADEACTLFEQMPSLRQTILRRIERDLEREAQACHYAHVQDLMAAFPELAYHEKRGCASCLVRLYPKLPYDLRIRILDLLLTSPYVVIRRRAYDALERDWRSALRTRVEQAWESHQDLECAHVIIDHFPVEYLMENRLDLQERVKGSRHLTRLFLRIGEKDQKQLKHLRRLDGITFAYVSTKLGRRLRPKDALQLYEEYSADRRIGLLIWCLGQMKLWNALVEIKTQMDKEEEARWGGRLLQPTPSVLEDRDDQKKQSAQEFG